VPADAFQAAISLHGQGRLREAERLYEAVLKADPEHFDTLHHLGVLRAQRGKVDDAIRLIRRALEINRQSAEALLDLGVVLEGAHRHAEAIPCYEKALALKPDYFEASFNLGTTLQALGRHDEAVPRFENALALQPMHAVAHDNLGISLHEIGRHPDAIRHFERALAIAPRNPAARNNLGTALQTLGRHTEAIAQLERAIALKPDYAQAHYNLGNSLYELDRVTESIACNKRAIALKPDYAKAHNNLGDCLCVLGRDKEAIPHFEKAFRLDPTYAHAHYNLGKALQSLNLHRESLARYEQALALDPGLPEAHWNEGLARLVLGDFRAGWKKFEWRWLTKLRRREFPQPLWLGEENLAGKTILLHAEQGFGDTLQFCRYAPLIRERGAEVILEVPPELAQLLRDSLAGPGLAVVARGAGDLPPFDVQCPLMSLPLACGTELETIPSRVPYLTADPARCAQWAAWLEDSAPAGPRVGFVWAGNPRKHDPHDQRTDAKRSIPLATLGPFFEIGGIAFISLQKGEAAAQLTRAGLQILDPSTELHSFADTAALVANLDLVVTVDTSVAHLAGGLGKPVWMLLGFDGGWRWLLDREDSPWYPTMRVFRQPAPHAWQPVIECVTGELSRFAAGDRAVHRPLR
jgi:tetratricopeptide (TPR) repeat protein